MNIVPQFRSFATTISRRQTDGRSDAVNELRNLCEKCTHCRQCYCRACGRLYHPDISQEETIVLFKKAV